MENILVEDGEVRAARTVGLLERRELEEMIAANESQEVVCDFCGHAYQVDPEAMRSLLEQIES